MFIVAQPFHHLERRNARGSNAVAGSSPEPGVLVALGARLAVGPRRPSTLPMLFRVVARGRAGERSARLVTMAITAAPTCVDLAGEFDGTGNGGRRALAHPAMPIQFRGEARRCDPPAGVRAACCRKHRFVGIEDDGFHVLRCQIHRAWRPGEVIAGIVTIDLERRCRDISRLIAAEPSEYPCEQSPQSTPSAAAQRQTANAMHTPQARRSR